MNKILTIEHDLRKEFQNILSILKIIKSENLDMDEELKEMIELCLSREDNITSRFCELSQITERLHG